MLNLLEDHFTKKVEFDQSKVEECNGFPEIVSKKENNKRAEILMQALGPNLRKLVKYSNTFSTNLVYANI